MKFALTSSPISMLCCLIKPKYSAPTPFPLHWPHIHSQSFTTSQEAQNCVQGVTNRGWIENWPIDVKYYLMPSKCSLGPEILQERDNSPRHITYLRITMVGVIAFLRVRTGLSAVAAVIVVVNLESEEWNISFYDCLQMHMQNAGSRREGGIGRIEDWRRLGRDI